MTIQKEIPLLQLENLNFSYGDVQVLWDVSFYVEVGKIVSLVGSNGAGKTTTLKVIAGLFKTFSGRIMLEGKLLTRSSAEEIRQFRNSLRPRGARHFSRHVGSREPRHGVLCQTRPPASR